MFKNYVFSKNPLHYVYAAVWLALFIFFAAYLFSGEMFQPQNGKIHLVAILIGWVVEFLGLVFTGIIIIVAGLLVACRTILEKKSAN